MVIQRKFFLWLAVLFLILSVIKLFNYLPGYLGVILIIGNFLLLFLCLEPFLVSLKIASNYFERIIFLLSYYSISLSIIYYLFGLNAYSLSFWLLINFIFILCQCLNYRIAPLKIDFVSLTKYATNFKLNKFEHWIIFIILIFLICYFFSLPIIDGNPSPWPKPFLLGFILFFLTTFYLVKELVFDKSKSFLVFLFYFLIISLIAIRYVLSYGYDTLIHQGALEYISTFGQITPLTPFYVGQYVLETLLFKFSGLSFIVIERWFGPVLFLTLTFFGGRYLLKRLKLNDDFILIPLSVIFLLPSIFCYTSPYATSLLWGILTVLFIILFLAQCQKSDYKLALLCSLVSFFIHPFVGLNILIWCLGIYFFQKNQLKSFTGKIYLGLIFIISSLTVIFAFVFYNWVKGNGLSIFNPLYSIGNFASIFTDPVWYLRGEFPWWLGLIYFYEKIQFFLMFFLVIYLPIKKFKFSGDIIVLISISTLISAWLFVSGFNIDNYFYGDQFNYGYRLVQVSKWFLWPILLILLAIFINYIKKQRVIWRYTVITILSIIVMSSWYLTYPRQDEISHMNVNSIRKIDYEAIDLVYNNENGKSGYFVLSNQIIGAGAIVKYGFGPYYKINKEESFYYSLPWGSTLSDIYNKIMAADNENLTNNLQDIKNIIKPLGIYKFYFIYTDAWQPSPDIIKQLKLLATEKWNLDNKIYIYKFKL